MRYRPFDQEAHLGPSPWDMTAPTIAAWERAHGHDVRIKCYPEYGCQVLEDEARDEGRDEAVKDILTLLSRLDPNVTVEAAIQLVTGYRDGLARRASR